MKTDMSELYVVLKNSYCLYDRTVYSKLDEAEKKAIEISGDVITLYDCIMQGVLI